MEHQGPISKKGECCEVGNSKAPPRNSLALPLRRVCMSTEQLPTIFMCEWTVIFKSFPSSRYIEIVCLHKQYYFESPFTCTFEYLGFPGGTVVKNPTANAGDAGSIPGSGRFPGGGNGKVLKLFQCSCWDNPMDRGAGKARVPEVAKSRT